MNLPLSVLAATGVFLSLAILAITSTSLRPKLEGLSLKIPRSFSPSEMLREVSLDVYPIKLIVILASSAFSPSSEKFPLKSEIVPLFEVEEYIVAPGRDSPVLASIKPPLSEL